MQDIPGVVLERIAQSFAINRKCRIVLAQIALVAIGSLLTGAIQCRISVEGTVIANTDAAMNIGPRFLRVTRGKRTGGPELWLSHWVAKKRG